MERPVTALGLLLLCLIPRTAVGWDFRVADVEGLANVSLAYGLLSRMQGRDKDLIAIAHEATALDPTYAPQTVNTDGWAATQGAWQALFPKVTVLLCFLHAFLKIRDRATKALRPVFEQGQERVGEAYQAPTKRAFAQRLRRLRDWAHRTLPDSAMKTHTLDLGDNRARFTDSYDHPTAHRTSNMVDRLMKFLDRACFNGQYFHGTQEAAEPRVRAWALLWNFCPSSPETVRKYQGQACPAERLTGTRYADNWLENLLVAASMNGVEHDQQTPL